MSGIALGFRLIIPVPCPDYADRALLPGTILSVSTCLCPVVPAEWLLAWVQSEAGALQRRAQRAHLRPDAVDAAVQWTTRAMDAGAFGWPDVVHELDAAREFARRFLADDAPAVLVGLAVSRDHAARLIDELRPRDPSQGEPGLHAQLVRGEPLPAGGVALGHEIAGTETGGGFHSWLCNGLAGPVAEHTGVKPNARGLIEDPADAARAAEYCGREDVGAEPGVWIPVRLVEYPRAV